MPPSPVHVPLRPSGCAPHRKPVRGARASFTRLKFINNPHAGSLAARVPQKTQLKSPDTPWRYRAISSRWGAGTLPSSKEHQQGAAGEMYTTPPTAALVATCASRRATDPNRPRTADPRTPTPFNAIFESSECLVAEAHKPSVSPNTVHRQTHRILSDSAGSRSSSSHPCKWHRVAPGG